MRAVSARKCGHLGGKQQPGASGVPRARTPFEATGIGGGEGMTRFMASLKYRCTALAAEIACGLMDFASAANGAEPQADSDGKISAGQGAPGPGG